jgi:AcrR family transcriptional regulator
LRVSILTQLLVARFDAYRPKASRHKSLLQGAADFSAASRKSRALHAMQPRLCDTPLVPMVRALRSPPAANDTPRDRKLQPVPRGARESDPARKPQPSARVARILRAAIEELARSDYGGLAFERVAARAGVNKTTVYRHWETKADLVRAALSQVLQSVMPEVSSGTLREDLIRIGRKVVDFSMSFEGQCLVRLRLLQHPEPELASIARDLHARHFSHLAALAEAATRRGDLPKGVDFKLLLDMLGGALHSRLVMQNESVDDVLIARMVDILLCGVGASYGRPAVEPAQDESRSRRRRS